MRVRFSVGACMGVPVHLRKKILHERNRLQLKRLAWVLYFVTLVSVGVGFAWFYWFVPFGEPPFPKRVDVAPGTGLRGIAHQLGREGLVRSALAFEALVFLKGDHKRMQAGEYQFDEPASHNDILEKLTKGDVFFHRVTVPEGWTMDQVAERLAREGLIQRSLFLRKAKNPDFILELLGFRVPSLEGFLFPDTYHFEKGRGEERILRDLVDHFNRALDARLRTKCAELGWSVLEVVTLASLIEKETGLSNERPLISGVFHERLRLGMRLESDPTVIYGLQDFDGKLRRRDLAEPHAYNTYRIKGLPPGPICNPGRDALEAAVFPSMEGYLYFVSRNDGSHQFSRTLREHLRAVNKYQRANRE